MQYTATNSVSSKLFLSFAWVVKHCCQKSGTVHEQDSFCRPLISCWLLRGAARREGNYLQSVQKHSGPGTQPAEQTRERCACTGERGCLGTAVTVPVLCICTVFHQSLKFKGHLKSRAGSSLNSTDPVTCATSVKISW